MALDARFYMHDADRMALDALKAVPGFTPLLKAFMKVFNEKQFYLQNMSTNLRLGENQLPQYYNMLPPICEKLGIEVPELFLELNGTPDAYTFGDTKPFIVITSGLLKKMPPEVIPTILAQECGHIACRHSLFTTMGRIIFAETNALVGMTDLAPFKDLLTLPLQMAFSYWMRCSELSADRAAIIYEQSPDNMIKACMCFSGLEKGIAGEVNVDAFMAQAQEYRDLRSKNSVDKTMEFLSNYNRSHPLNAVRACECRDWANSERFEKICRYVHCAAQEGLPLSAYLSEVPTVESVRYYVGKETEETVKLMRQLGFENVSTVRTTLKKGNIRPGQVTTITVGDRDGFQKYEWLPILADVKVEFYEPETEEEIAAAHPGQLRTPNSAKYYLSSTIHQTEGDFRQAGFANVTVENLKRGKKGWFDKNEAVIKISVNGQTRFEKGEWFPIDSQICITYVTYTG